MWKEEAIIAKEGDELLCRVEPGTPLHEAFKLYWQPAGLSEDLTLDGALGPLPWRPLADHLSNELGVRSALAAAGTLAAATH